EGRRELHDDQWTSALDARDEARVEAARLRLEHARSDLDVRGAQESEALAVAARIRVAHRRHDTADPGLADRVDARRRAADVRARLEGRVQSGATGAVARLAERDYLGVRLACRGVESF